MIRPTPPAHVGAGQSKGLRVDPIILGAGAFGALVVLYAAAYFYAPARATIIVDTSASTARAELKTLWGMGPMTITHILPKTEVATPLETFGDPERIGLALMTPGIANVVYTSLQQLFAHKPREARLELGLNLADSAQTRVIQTAAEAPLASAPLAMRDAVAITRCANPGAELIARFELSISPTAFNAIYNRLKNSGPAREFRKRLRKKPKPMKKPVREVQTS